MYEPKDIQSLNVSDDTISRTAILNEISDIGIRAFGKYGRSFGFITELYNFVRDLPSSAPKQRTGHWIRTRKEEVTECVAGTGIHVYVCSKCDEWENFPSEYCPNCGAKMQDETETQINGR